MPEMCQLSINVPKSITQELMSHLLLIPDVISGCTTVHSLGFGRRQHYRNLQEQIRGATERNLVIIILSVKHIDTVIAHINQQFNGTELFYWAIPLLTHGYLANGEYSS